MLVPLSWLNKYVSMNLTSEEFKNKMVLAGFEIAFVDELFGEISGVVIGRITKLEKHQSADRLQVCQVDVGSKTVQIVTGANNVFEGAIIPVALDGATLHGGQQIKKSKLRGVDSDGMLCSGAELGMDQDHYPAAAIDGIMILQEEYPLGKDAMEALGLRDTVFEFEITANRPDCMSILGIAREAAVVLNTDLKKPDIHSGHTEGDVKDRAQIEVLDTQLCPRYIGAMVENITIKQSPRWMKLALKAAGIRPINNIVDITNFVMLETGQPMHAFDFQYVRKNKIIVRRANKDETLTTLDGKHHLLDETMLLITDGEGPVGLAGIMGGENSEIRESTKTVLLESANFKALSVRSTSKKLGITSEAAARFSKGLDAERCELAIRRALHLVGKLEAGTVVGGFIDANHADAKKRVIKAEQTQIHALLGMSIPAKEALRILSGLEIKAAYENGIYTCEIPVFRNDLEGMADIAEEIGRIYGYDHVPMTMMQGGISRGKKTRKQMAVDRIKDTLTASGAYEIVTYSFESPLVYDILKLTADHPLRQTVRIRNPFGEDQSIMRTSLIPSMLRVVSANANRSVEHARFFEIGKAYIRRENDLPQEPEIICIGVYGGEEDFYTIKGILENLASAFGVAVEFEAGGEEYFHPYRKAIVTVGGEVWGEIGQVDNEAAEKFDCSGPVYIAQLQLDVLLKNRKNIVQYEQLPKYPAATRDMAVIVDQDIQAGDLLKAIKSSGGAFLESVTLFDVYTGKQVEEGKKSLAYSLVFRSTDKTLDENDIQPAFENILKLLNSTFSANLRK
ncbi:MAG: phenylalanine--tRNA ligase subunit beta [Christensenellales bacterium]